MGRRRSNGEGTLFKRKDGRWSAQAYVKLPNGTTKRVCITGRDYESVKKKLREALDQTHHNIPFVEKEWTVGEYLDYWMREVQPNRIRETTLSVYRVKIEHYIKPALGGIKLSSLNIQDVRRALDTLKIQGHSGRTGQHFLQILSSYLTNAMREELIFRNVAQLVDKPKHTPKATVIWTTEQAALFLENAKDHPQHIAFLLFLTYGMRRGEVLGLRWEDIDFENGLIHVRQQIDRIGEIKARDLKTANSRRILPLLANVRATLMDCVVERGIEPTPFNPYFIPSTKGTVVVSEAGTPLEPRNLTRCFGILTKKAGLPRIKVHAMRHTAATALKDLGVPIKDAQLILGHSSITTTLNIYQHGTPETHRVALSALEKRLSTRKSGFTAYNQMTLSPPHYLYTI